MTTQEQLEKIIKSWIEKLSKEEECPHIIDIDFYDIKKVVDTILSAMRINEEVLKVIIDKELASNVTWRHIDFPDDFDYDRIMTRIFYDISKAIASHAQEIIKFEEE